MVERINDSAPPAVAAAQKHSADLVAASQAIVAEDVANARERVDQLTAARDAAVGETNRLDSLIGDAEAVGYRLDVSQIPQLVVLRVKRKTSQDLQAEVEKQLLVASIALSATVAEPLPALMYGGRSFDATTTSVGHTHNRDENANANPQHMVIYCRDLECQESLKRAGFRFSPDLVPLDREEIKARADKKELRSDGFDQSLASLPRDSSGEILPLNLNGTPGR
jgi:hypothetical protein